MNCVALERAVLLKAQLVESLGACGRRDWLLSVRAFFARLAETGLEDRTVLLTLLSSLSVEIRLVAGSRGPRLPGAADIWNAIDPCSGDALRRVESIFLTSISRWADADRSDCVKQVLEVIDRRYAERLTLPILAGAVNCRRERIATLFRQETGFTIHRYLTQVRMERAANLIRSGEKIEAVMLMVGYRSKRNFYRHFRVLTGATPAGFRAIPIGHGSAQLDTRN